jgi:tRNA(fMet)-specific endonuclease VapC
VQAIVYLLDTNAVSNYLRGTYPKLCARIGQVPKSNLWISSITVGEIVRGRLEQVKRALDEPSEVAVCSELLVRTVVDLAAFQLLPYAEDAANLFLSWPSYVHRRGSNDCRIAASALTAQMTIITSDKDFSHIPDAKWENWA